MKPVQLLGALLFVASFAHADVATSDSASDQSSIGQALSTDSINLQDANEIGFGGGHGGPGGPGGGFGGGGQHGPGGAPGGGFGGGHGPVGPVGPGHGAPGNPGGFGGGHGPIGPVGPGPGHGGPGFPGYPGHGGPIGPIHGGPGYYPGHPYPGYPGGFPVGFPPGWGGGYYHPVPPPYPIEVGGQITCLSGPGQTNFCGTGWPVNYATVVQQYTARQCVDGYTFGISPDRMSIWVSDGCRATFIIN